ncbi:hypothetical protein CR513_04715, partial [Mucuna pruriens]
MVSPPNDKSIIGTKWIFRNWMRMVRLCIIKQDYIKWISNVLFLNGIINEEVFVKQPPSFESDTFPNHVFKLKKTLNGLKQALRFIAYDKWFSKRKVDTTLFHKNYDSHFIIVKIYVDDIIFCATDDSLCEEFSELMQKEFEISMMG